MTTNIIGRSSGRSAVGAAAYRSGEKLNSINHAAYQSGEKLQYSSKITHDYRRKKGIAHSEIMLPDNAPPEYADRQTLWNAVEANEKRKDAQLAREIIVALPKEFNFDEQITVSRKYIQENFTSKGMIADFAIHNNDGNPHIHIMLTMRHVSRDGFGLKNTDWNKKENLLAYREAWTHIINNTFTLKGLDERIDHRSYKEQGIDREPMIHLGHEAAALEKKGIATLRGDYNREIQRRNNQRAELEEEEKILAEMKEEIKEIHQVVKSLQQQLTVANPEPEPNEVITKFKTSNRLNESPEIPATPQKKRTKKVRFLQKVKTRKESQEKYVTLKRDLHVMTTERDVHGYEMIYSYQNSDVIQHSHDVRAADIRLRQLREDLQDSRFWELIRKKAIKKEIEQVEADKRIAQHYINQAGDKLIVCI